MDENAAEEAQAAYDAAPVIPLSEERIQEIVAYAPTSPGPQTHEEARQLHEGFLSGATAYAAAVGHSTLKSNNPKLCEVFDAQGWRTIECGESSTNPGQFVRDNRWVCSEECRRNLINVDSYDDLRESGGIVDAP